MHILIDHAQYQSTGSPRCFLSGTDRVQYRYSPTLTAVKPLRAARAAEKDLPTDLPVLDFEAVRGPNPALVHKPQTAPQEARCTRPTAQRVIRVPVCPVCVPAPPGVFLPVHVRRTH